MCNRYMIRAKNYDSPAYSCQYQHELLIPALLKLIELRFKYDLVEFEYRKK